jgi:hypothetical protein
MYYTNSNIYYIKTVNQTVYFIKADNDDYFTSPYNGLILLKVKNSHNKDGCKKEV